MRKQILPLAIAAISFTIISCSDSANTPAEKKDSPAATTPTTENTTNQPMEEEGVMVGGAKMVPSKNIVENASGSADHKTLVSAVQAAGLVETLSGVGPFTVFAPTDAAFNKLPAGTVENLVKPENKETLGSILKYHVVSGSAMAADLKDGQELTTVQGNKLTVMMKDGKVMLKDAKGGMATVTIADVKSSNGVTHVIDGVLMSK